MNPQLPSVSAPFGADSLDFVELWRTMFRLRWQILGIVLVFGILGTLVAFSTEPVYRATVTLLIEARPRAAIEVREVYDPGVESEDYFDTQTELLKSRDLVGRVVDELGLMSNSEIVPPYEPTLWQQFLSGAWLPFIPSDEPAAAAEDSALVKREIAIDGVMRRMKVSTIARTQLRKIHFESRDPALAAQVANSVADMFISSGLDSRLDATERATRWLTQRLADLKTKLEESEHALQRYREEHQLVNVGGTRGLYEEEVIDNARKLRDAQRKKTELASTYWKIQQAGDDDSKLQEVSALLVDTTVQRASENLLQADQTVKQLEDRYGTKHPQMTTARARLEGARHSYFNQLRLAANGIKAEYEIAAETERALLGIVQSGKAQIRKLDQSGYEVQSLEREVQTNRELFEMFLRRYKETDTASSYGPMAARIVDHAVVPSFPFKPNKPRVIALWLFGGLLLALVLAALRHMLSEIIRSPEHLEQLTQLPVISVLPPVAGLGRKASAPEMVVDHPRAPFAEGVRSIRASLHLSDVDKRMKKVMFTSALPREGKSSLASAFAAVLGHTERIVLIEADLRAPSLKKIFGIPAGAPGVVELLSGQAKLDEVLYDHAPSGIQVLPVAQIPANPAEVVASAAFAKLLDILAARFDRVIVDTPPCQVASDSLLLAHRMDAVLFVIHGTTTGTRTIQTAIKHLRAAHAPLLGHILNQVDARKAYGYDGNYFVYGNYGQA
jgi:polysaccharide biosynthesis transport protein